MMNLPIDSLASVDETSSVRCPVCCCTNFDIGAEVFDDRYGEPNLYYLARCRHCSHLATAPKLDESQLPSLYGTYYPRKGIRAADVQQTAQAVSAPFARWVRWWQGVDNQGQYMVRRGEHMLDIGCGSGASLLEAQALGAVAFGIEADPNVRAIADQLGLRVHFGSLHDQPFPDQRFELVVLNQVIEHLPEPDMALKLLRERLAPGGRVVLVFPNQGSIWRRLTGMRWIHWHIPYHLHHFDRAGFSRMAQRCGYRVSSVRSITPNLWSVLQLRAVLRPATRGEAHPQWAVRTATAGADGTTPRRASPRRWLLTLALLPLALINRLVDAYGAGDSLLVVLHPESNA